MIELKVFFTDEIDFGTAMLFENSITNEVILELSTKLLIGETKIFINKAVDILKRRYGKVNVNINWDTAIGEKEDKDVITSK